MLKQELKKLFPDAKCELNYHNIFELSVAVILSAQTTDKSVNLVTPTLFKKYPTLYDLSNANVSDVEQIIKSIGLYKRKKDSLKTVFSLANNCNFDTNQYLNDRLNLFKKCNASFVAPAVSEYPFLFSNRVKGPT